LPFLGDIHSITIAVTVQRGQNVEVLDLMRVTPPARIPDEIRLVALRPLAAGLSMRSGLGLRSELSSNLDASGLSRYFTKAMPKETISAKSRFPVLASWISANLDLHSNPLLDQCVAEWVTSMRALNGTLFVGGVKDVVEIIKGARQLASSSPCPPTTYSRTVSEAISRSLTHKPNTSQSLRPPNRKNPNAERNERRAAIRARAETGDKID